MIYSENSYRSPFLGSRPIALKFSCHSDAMLFLPVFSFMFNQRIHDNTLYVFFILHDAHRIAVPKATQSSWNCRMSRFNNLMKSAPFLIKKQMYVSFGSRCKKLTTFSSHYFKEINDECSVIN